jgi:hypothetical protein
VIPRGGGRTSRVAERNNSGVSPTSRDGLAKIEEITAGISADRKSMIPGGETLVHHAVITPVGKREDRRIPVSGGTVRIGITEKDHGIATSRGARDTEAARGARVTRVRVVRRTGPRRSVEFRSRNCPRASSRRTWTSASAVNSGVFPKV